MSGWGDFAIGIVVSVLASIMNAAGLNLLNLDHIKNSKLAPEMRRNECGRPMWHLGLYLYIVSQLVGSTIALNFLKASWVAPLGSVALIFNFIFARAFVGTRITRKDIIGTFVVIASVVWIVVFGGLHSEGDENLTLERLRTLFTRTLFVVYFTILEIITILWFGIAIYGYWFAKEEQRRRRHNIFRLVQARRLKKYVGMLMASVGGLIASQTLLLAKSGVKLFTNSFATGKNEFTDSLSIFIVISLLITAVLQVYCLNTGLKLYDSVLIVPIFFAFYTAMGLINSMIYLDEISRTPVWVVCVIMVGIGTLIYGVVLLSETKEDAQGADDKIGDQSKDEIALSPVPWDKSINRPSSAMSSSAAINASRVSIDLDSISSRKGSKGRFSKIMRLRKESIGSSKELADDNTTSERTMLPDIVIAHDADESSSDTDSVDAKGGPAPSDSTVTLTVGSPRYELARNAPSTSSLESDALTLSPRVPYDDDLDSVLDTRSTDDLLRPTNNTNERNV